MTQLSASGHYGIPFGSMAFCDNTVRRRGRPGEGEDERRGILISQEKWG